MQLEYLEYLTKITPGITIDALAENLHITRSGLSKALTVLEENFNCQLIIRTRKGMYLTAEANEIIEYTKEYFDKINKYRFTHPPLSGPLLLPIAMQITRYFGTESISYFIKENPNVDLKVYNIDSNNVLSYLDKPECEIAISFLLWHEGKFYPPCPYNIWDPKKEQLVYTGTRPEYTFVPCVTTRVAFECHKDLAVSLKHFSVSDLSNSKILLNTTSEIFDNAPFNDFCKTNFHLNYTIEPDSYLYYKMLQNKIGYGLCLYSSTQILPDNIVQIFPEDKIFTTYGFIEKTSRHSPAFQRFIEILLEKH